MFNKVLSLSKSKSIFNTLADRYRKKVKKISIKDQEFLKKNFRLLNEAIDNKDRKTASELAINLKSICAQCMKKDFFDYTKDLVFGVGLTLLIAGVIRQTWFEHYRIPTGSMRPTFFEKDHLIASKTTFGINIPFKADQFYFDSSLMKRGNIFVFTLEGMDTPHTDTRHFFLFPGKKRLVKRLIGLPGDTLYFYGGKVYGIDKEGNEIRTFLDQERFDKLEYVPFITFEGRAVTPEEAKGSGVQSPAYLYQTGMPISKLLMTEHGQFKSRSIATNHTKKLDDLFGINNFAMCRVLTKQQALKFNHALPKDAKYYLELSHTPLYSQNKPHLSMDNQGRVRPTLTLQNSLIPLDNDLVYTLKKNLYTSRFVVRNGYASHFSMSKNIPQKILPHFSNVEDGTYEFYHGVGYKVVSTGVRVPLKIDHPLNSNDPEHIVKLFNLGIQFLNFYDPSQDFKDLIPARYSYFRDGDLYVMGAPLLKSNDPTLKSYLSLENTKSYPFIDNGPPLKPNGSLDIEKVKTYGLVVPDDSVLGLGDNHASSDDCREFGFIPTKNLRGSPSYVIWPPSPRMGAPNQTPYQRMTFSNIFIWTLGSSLLGLWFFLTRGKKNKDYFYDQSPD